MDGMRTALVLGATGGIGGAVARRLQAEGWAVRALHRDPAAVRREGDGFAWVRGDARDTAAVTAAARGAALIVHAVNPPGYRDWDALVLPMLEASLAAAQASGARILLPGNVYNFGPDAGPHPDEDAPQNPLTRKGTIRVAMERRLEAAAETGVRSLIVRAGDFFGPGMTGNSWFSLFARRGRPVRSLWYPGPRGVGHQWAYLPDLAETMVRLAGREAALPAFARFHCGGHWDADGTQMAAAIARALGRPHLPVRRVPWGLARIAAPFVPFLREVQEMLYLWREPLRLDNRRLVALLGAEPHTPLDAAVAATLADLGCLPDGAAGPARGPMRRDDALARVTPEPLSRAGEGQG
ncbi:NAD-dependent epimerase/dehydratase family protein [Methylobacterium nodulans]|uniref:NAD-dependent epimerase/dehydratase n=1 Tax=Methylobacterium nodulans (strain LMG 21967 / CNCM I-2342 / ORS 2060) TaxID=460265 RepID=B8ITW4_METNO|nr:NAD-dependent epimerase/dehydratase family protein [Methylobacterium nodulans]ACL60822.1 NAD-dependent epimerase/dehydratase [Methylobacterium nodulans ORS 2060]